MVENTQAGEKSLGKVTQNMQRERVTIEGEEVASCVAYKTNEVVRVYTITPSPDVGEKADARAAEGRMNIRGAVPATRTGSPVSRRRRSSTSRPTPSLGTRKFASTSAILTAPARATGDCSATSCPMRAAPKRFPAITFRRSVTREGFTELQRPGAGAPRGFTRC